MNPIRKHCNVYKLLLFHTMLQTASCQMTDFTRFQVISKRQVIGQFETRFSSSLVECAAACVQNSRAAGSCVSTNFNSGSNTCGLSTSNGDSLNTVSDEHAFVLVPYEAPECSTPSHISHGTYSLTNDIVTYNCDTGYTPNGAVTRICQNGAWSGSTPTCVENAPVCPSNETLANGTVTISNNILSYTCKTGFTLSGASTRICSHSGWSGIPSVCIIDCGTFTTSSFANTEVVTSSSCTTVGCTVHVQCQIGFKQPSGITAPTEIVCSSDGSWIGSSSDPDCSYELMFRGTAENGHNISAAYLYGSVDDGVSSDEACMDVHNTACTKHYRNYKIDSWASLGISNILYELYKDRLTVIAVTFDGAGSDMTTWMGNDVALKATAWPWTDMTSSSTSWWSLFKDIGYGRSFRILHNYGNCNDDYYSVVLFEPTHGCHYESHSTWPRIMYSDTTGYLNFNTQVYKEASSMAVWVQTTN